MYHNHFASHQNGEVGITLNIDWAEPVYGDNADHLAASDRAIQFHLGWFAHPIFIDGAYPAIMREKVLTLSDCIVTCSNKRQIFIFLIYRLTPRANSRDSRNRDSRHSQQKRWLRFRVHQTFWALTFTRLEWLPLNPAT